MNNRTAKRTFRGEVVSDASDKTIVVRVDRTVVHPKYGKRYVQSKKMHAHDERNEYKVGDLVTIRECRPMSKNKRWRVVPKQESTN